MAQFNKLNLRPSINFTFLSRTLDRISVQAAPGCTDQEPSTCTPDKCRVGEKFDCVWAIQILQPYSYYFSDMQLPEDATL